MSLITSRIFTINMRIYNINEFIKNNLYEPDEVHARLNEIDILSQHKMKLERALKSIENKQIFIPPPNINWSSDATDEESSPSYG